MANRITRPRQGRFRRGETFVVVRPVRITSAKTLEVGDEITQKDLRGGYLRSLFQRRRLGTKGSAWVEMQLAKDAGDLTSQEAAEAVGAQRLAEAETEAAARALADKNARVGEPIRNPDADPEVEAAELAKRKAGEDGVDEAIEDLTG